MFAKTDELKVLRDPVHGYIRVELQVIWDCINSAWFQRLRRIRQLGGANMVYHCAEHTRFSHSLGVYEVVRRMVSEVPDIVAALSERDKVVVMAAGLLHDLGHGPYSHTFELVTNTSHEEYTCRIIEEDTEITRILNSAAPGLAKEVADVIRHTSANPLLSQIVSSQLDADRMDYLLRDAYFTGTKYGEFDMERILRTLRIEDGRQLVVKQSGVYAVENYIMSRYHMYWQVYYHPTARSFECVMNALFRRIKELYGPANEAELIDVFRPLIKNRPLSLAEYFRLDESSCGYAFDVLAGHPDRIISDMAGRIRDRRLFVYADSTPESIEEVRKKLAACDLSEEYYLGHDSVRQNPYVPYTGQQDGSIWVRMKDGSVRELSNASNIVYSLTHGPTNDDNKIFFPRELAGLD